MFLIISPGTFSQNRQIYFDGDGAVTAEHNAVFRGEFVEDGDYLNLTVYAAGSGSIICRQQLKNSDKSTPVGLQLFYYEEGQLKDSTFYNDSTVLFSYHYYPNGRLHARFVYTENPKQVISEGFDETGNKIKKFVFWQAAEYAGGYSNWVRYINQNIPPYFTELGRIDTIVTAQIGFAINELGQVVDPVVLKSSGYEKIDKNALQIVRNSRLWKSAILYNEPVTSYRRETFEYNLNGAVRARSHRIARPPSRQSARATLRLIINHYLHY